MCNLGVFTFLTHSSGLLIWPLAIPIVPLHNWYSNHHHRVDNNSPTTPVWHWWSVPPPPPPPPPPPYDDDDWSTTPACQCQWSHHPSAMKLMATTTSVMQPVATHMVVNGTTPMTNWGVSREERWRWQQPSGAASSMMMQNGSDDNHLVARRGPW